MKKACALGLLLFLLTATNSFAVTFSSVEIFSSNSAGNNWQLGTDLFVNGAVSPTVTYYINSDGPYPMPFTSVWAGSLWLYLDDICARYSDTIPSDFNGDTFTWTVADTENNLYATGVASGIRQVPLSRGLTLSGDPYHPTLSWSNSDPALDSYNIRLFDATGALLGQWSVPLSSNPSFTFTAFTFELGKSYTIRVEAQDFVYFDLVDDSGNPLSLKGRVLNRSNSEIQYSVGVSFNFIEVYSNNDEEYGWVLGTSLILNHPSTPTVAYSVNGGGFNPMSRLTMPVFQGLFVYHATLSDQLGGSPLDYNGSAFTWGVDDFANDLSSTASIASGIRQVLLSTSLTVTGDPVHPTVSWYNPDPNLRCYRVRVQDASGNILWQSPDLAYSSYGANATYTINGFTFEPGIEYTIGVEAREYLYFPFAAGSDIPSNTSTLRLVNRSTAKIVYNAWPALSIIGTATYNGSDYNLIYEASQGIVWLDYSSYQNTWSQQMGWASGLNISGVLTYKWNQGITVAWNGAWRLPSAGDNPQYDYNQITSEMGHLYYESLGNSAGGPPANVSPFLHLLSTHYYSGTEWSEDVGWAWNFWFTQGLQGLDHKATDLRYALAVRPGVVVVDSSLPETSIVSILDDNGMAVTTGGATTSGSITFAFSGIDDGSPDVDFECSLDAGTFALCTSPATYGGLSLGIHSFNVRAVDEVGNVDATPAQFTWTVITPAQGISELIDYITETLPGKATNLSAPLNNAHKRLTDTNPNNDVAACNNLNAFINQVNAGLNAGRLTDEQAASLIQSAEAIETAQGCP